MVIKSKIYDFLKKNLGEYLYGFEKNQLDVGLLSGRIELVNVNFRPDKVNELLASQGLPVHIKAGLIGKLKLKCNYITFLTSPIELELDELLLVFGPITHMYKEHKLNQETDSDVILWQLSKESEILNYGKRNQRACSYPEFLSASESDNSKQKKNKDKDKIKASSKKNWTEKNTESEIDTKKTKRKKTRRSGAVQSADDEILDPSNLKPNGFSFEERLKQQKPVLQENSYSAPQQKVKKKESFLEKYFTKVLRNLKLTVKSVHVIYEDDSYPFENPLSMGVSVDSLEVKNISAEWGVSSGKQVKVVSKNRTSVKEVLVSNVSIFIYSMASIIIPISLYEETIDSPIGIFEAFPAYEVRDMIIQQCKFLSKNHPSTFLPPTSGKACISFSEDVPNIKAVGFIDSFSCKFTPAMGECLRNFYDYCTNVQIWPLVLRHKPFETIPPRPAKREHRKQRKVRSEIIKKWFQYAFMFAKLKVAALKYVKGRRKDREITRKKEEQERIKEKVFKRSVQRPATGVDKKEVAKENSTISSFLSMGKKKINQGKGMLAGIIDGMHSKKPPIVQKQVKRPYDGEEYFSKALCNTELEIHINTLSIDLFDEDSKINFKVSCTDFVKCTTTLLDEMSSIWTLQEFCVTLTDHKKTLEIFRCSGNTKNKNSTADQALKAKFIYRPSEILIPNDVYNTYNMYEYSVELGNFNAKYSHKLLKLIFSMKESISLDKSFRLNANEKFMKMIVNKNKPSVKVFTKKDKAKIATFNLFCGYIDELEKWVERKTAELNSNFPVILFSTEFTLHGGEINFDDHNNKHAMSLAIPNGAFQVCKNKEVAYVSAFGLRVKTASTPAGLHAFCTIIKNLLSEQLKRLRNLTTSKV